LEKIDILEQCSVLEPQNQIGIYTCTPKKLAEICVTTHCTAKTIYIAKIDATANGRGKHINFFFHAAS